jgi:hypothetical protein
VAYKTRERIVTKVTQTAREARRRARRNGGVDCRGAYHPNWGYAIFAKKSNRSNRRSFTRALIRRTQGSSVEIEGQNLNWERRGKSHQRETSLEQTNLALCITWGRFYKQRARPTARKRDVLPDCTEHTPSRGTSDTRFDDAGPEGPDDVFMATGCSQP